MMLSLRKILTCAHALKKEIFYYVMSFRLIPIAFHLFAVAIYSLESPLPHASPSIDQMALAEIGLSLDIPPSKSKPISFRERVCNLQQSLGNTRVLTQIIGKWLDSDFRNSKDNDLRMNFAKTIISESAPIHVSRLYFQILLNDKKLKMASCSDLEDFTEGVIGNGVIGNGGTSLFPGKNSQGCDQQTRRKILSSAVFSSQFVDSRIAIHFKDKKGPIESLPMYQSTKELADPLAAISVRLAMSFPLRGKEVLQESMGTPRGPYACQTASEMRENLPIISTTFYYWYDFLSGAQKSMSSTESKWLPSLSIAPVSLSGVHFERSEWFTDEFETMKRAGINTAYLVYRGGPFGRFTYADKGLESLVRALAMNEKPLPLVAPVIDGSIFSRSGNTLGEHIDLSTRRGAAILFATVRDFLSQIPPQFRASYQGRPLIAFKNMNQSKSLGDAELQWFKVEVSKFLGVYPFLIIPREEIVRFVGLGNSETVQMGVNGLIQGQPSIDVFKSVIGAEALKHRFGQTNSDLARLLFSSVMRMATPPKYVLADQIQFARNTTRSEVARTAYSAGYEFILEGYRARIEGRTPQYEGLLERAKKGERILLNDLSEIYAHAKPLQKLKGADLSMALNYGILGKCPDKTNLEKLASMLNTFNRETAASYLLSTREALRHLISGWIVDSGMVSKVTGDFEIIWEPEGCAIPSGVAVIFPGRDEAKIARLTKRSPLIIGRNNGGLFDTQWKLLADQGHFPEFVHVESWNGYHDATAISATHEYGARYVDLTRSNINAYLARYKSHVEKKLAEKTGKKVDRGVSSVNKVK